jgi:hypothetical protein
VRDGASARLAHDGGGRTHAAAGRRQLPELRCRRIARGEPAHLLTLDAACSDLIGSLHRSLLHAECGASLPCPASIARRAHLLCISLILSAVPALFPSFCSRTRSVVSHLLCNRCASRLLASASPPLPAERDRGGAGPSLRHSLTSHHCDIARLAASISPPPRCSSRVCTQGARTNSRPHTYTRLSTVLKASS